LSETDFLTFLTAAEEAARLAGDVLESWAGRFTVSEKSPANLVTEADLAAQEAIYNHLHARFPDCSAVVYGHSHLPEISRYSDVWILNPGSPTDKRRQPEHTFALLRVEEGEVRAEILVL
jgi:predicted phosphodiesterase